MKSLIATIVILVTIVAGTITNSIILTSTLKTIYSSLENQANHSDSKEEAVNATSLLLDSNRNYLYFALPSNLLDELYSEYAESCEYHQQGDISSYKATLEKVKDKVSSLIMQEEFTFSNIF